MTNGLQKCKRTEDNALLEETQHDQFTGYLWISVGEREEGEGLDKRGSREVAIADARAAYPRE